MPKDGVVIINIFSVANSAKSGLKKTREAFKSAIDVGVKMAAKQLLQDCRPYVPLLTGRLRDSGHIESMAEDYAYKLIWDAANPLNEYIYAAKQYEQVLQHVDGKYAAEWIRKTLDANRGRYKALAARYMAIELKKALGT